MKKLLILFTTMCLMGAPVQAFAEDKPNLDDEISKVEKQINDLQAKLKELKAQKSEQSGVEYKEFNYDDVARDKDGKVGEFIIVTGKVLQYMEGDDRYQVRLATSYSDYDETGYGSEDVYLIEGDIKNLSGRLLEDDVITVKGLLAGQYSYKSVMGGTITLPSILVSDVEIH